MTPRDRPNAAEWLESGSPQPELTVVGVPSSAGSPPTGQTHLAPPRLRHVLERFSTYHSEAEVDLGDLAVRDVGDWPVGGAPPTAAHDEIEQRSAALDHSLVHLFVGGDHSITHPVVAGFGLAGLGLLVFDSRVDTAAGDAPERHTVLRRLIEDGLPGERITQIGLHGFANSVAERRFSEEHGISTFPMDTIDLWGIEETVTVALDQLARTAEWIYASFDLGVLDVAFAPGCSDSRPGGLAPRQLATAATLSGRHPLVRAADFVEVDPHLDHDDLTTMNLASAVLSFAAGVAARPEADT